MRPPARLLNAETLALRGPRSLYVCSTCRQTASPRAGVFMQTQSRQASSNADPLTEKVRRKLWGTDNPPGLKDPYGGKGILEQKFGRASAVEEGAEEEQAKSQLDVPAEEAQTGEVEGQDGEYVPAVSWEGIEKVGHLGRWNDLPPAEGDVYTPFKVRTPVTKRGHLNLAAHQAAVEIALLYALKKPLTSICDVVEHDKSVFKMLWKCKIQPGANGWDGAVVYPNKETETALAFIFEQIGSQPDVVAEGTAEAGVAVDESESVDADVEAPFELDEATSSLPFFGYSDVRDRGFLSLPLDESTKFAYLKRFSQLSGHFFPDTAIHSISSVKQVVDYIHRAQTPKPTKLADQLARKGSILNRPNIKVFAKKQKLSDRDEELGRKKIIGAELRARGLL